MLKMDLLIDLAKVIRSKNAGPFMTSIDIFFDERKNYEKVKKTLTPKIISELYNISIEDVVGIFCLDIVMGIKVTITKPIGTASGDQKCSDIFGANQHVPLFYLSI
jgi:hypothetical protein